MCFSAPASFIAGGALCAIGRETVKKTRVKTELPFASIPLIFGIQQFIEGLVWISLGTPMLNLYLNHLLSFAFTFFAYVFWPVFVPVAILLMETDLLRRKILKVFACMGFITGIYLFYTMVNLPVTSQIVQNSISYSMGEVYSIPVFFMYLAATCATCIASSHRMVNIFGITLFASCFFSYQCYTYTFFSVWCFFAALLSFIVYLHFSPLNDVVREIKSRLRMA